MATSFFGATRVFFSKALVAAVDTLPVLRSCLRVVVDFGATTTGTVSRAVLVAVLLLLQLLLLLAGGGGGGGCAAAAAAARRVSLMVLTLSPCELFLETGDSRWPGRCDHGRGSRGNRYDMNNEKCFH
jgi:hypothetical protein